MNATEKRGRAIVWRTANTVAEKRRNEILPIPVHPPLSGKSYIGVTKNQEKRQKQHAIGRSGARAFNNAVKKYGIGAFDLRVLAVFDDYIEASRIEQAAIQAFGTLSPSGYNLTAGAPFTQYNGPISEETRSRLSAVSKGIKMGPRSAKWRKHLSEAINAYWLRNRQKSESRKD